MTETIKALVEGGKASAGPSLGPALGPMGVDIMQVINTINDKTKHFEGMKVPVKVTIDPETKKFEIKEQDKKYNMTVTPFLYNYIEDWDALTDDQNERIETLRKYFSNLACWTETKKEKNALVTWMLAYIGYTLTSWREKCFHVWVGKTDSGKTQLSKILSFLHMIVLITITTISFYPC